MLIVLNIADFKTKQFCVLPRHTFYLFSFVLQYITINVLQTIC